MIKHEESSRLLAPASEPALRDGAVRDRLKEPLSACRPCAFEPRPRWPLRRHVHGAARCSKPSRLL